MTKKQLPQPSPGELDLLNVLWESGPLTVKQLHEQVSQTQPVQKTLTTTLKLVQIMEQKGLVERRGEGRPYVFHPVLAERETQKQLLKDIMARGFQGSAKNLVLCAIEATGISGKELGEIRALLNARKKGE